MIQPNLRDQVRDALRVRHCSIPTEEFYLHWIKRFILFHDKRHPADEGGEIYGMFDLPSL